MDPNATLQAIDEALNVSEYEEAHELVIDLTCWIRNGGFEPNWSEYPTATRYVNYINNG